MGNGGLQPIHHTLSLLLLPPQGQDSSHSFPDPVSDSPPWAPPMWVLPMGCSSLHIATACIPSTGCSPSGAHYSSTGPLQRHNSCQEICSSVDSYLHGSTGTVRTLLQHVLPIVLQPPSGIYLLWPGVFCQWDWTLLKTDDVVSLKCHSGPAIHISVLVPKSCADLTDQYLGPPKRIIVGWQFKNL